MDLSIIYVNWNSLDYLRGSISSVYQHTRNIAFEIIVVDNASTETGIETLAQQFPKVVVVKSDKNLGFAGANNIGFKHSSGEFVLLLNPDTKLISPSINIMVEHIRSLPDAGIVGCKLLNTDGSVQLSSIQKFPTILNQAIDAEFLRLRWPHCRLWEIAPLFANHVKAITVDVIPGACMLLRRRVFQDVGLYSEDYFMYAEDLDLNYKLKQAGFRNYYVGETAIIHYGGGSSSRQKVSRLGDYHEISRDASLVQEESWPGLRMRLQNSDGSRRDRPDATTGADVTGGKDTPQARHTSIFSNKVESGVDVGGRIPRVGAARQITNSIGNERNEASVKKARRKMEETLWVTGLHAPFRSLYRVTAGRKRTRVYDVMMEFYRSLVKPDALVFDIGANVGLFSEIFSSLGARVVAIEPNADCVRHMQLSYAEARIEVIQAVAGAANGLATIHLSDERDDISSVSSDWIEAIKREHHDYDGLWSRRVPVPMLTLDTLSAYYGSPQFIKIDVEGFEESVLDGLSAQPPLLSFEFNTAYMDAAIRCLDKKCFDRGSVFNLALGDPSGFELEKWIGKQELKQKLSGLGGGDKHGDIFVRSAHLEKATSTQ